MARIYRPIRVIGLKLGSGLKLGLEGISQLGLKHLAIAIIRVRPFCRSEKLRIIEVRSSLVKVRVRENLTIRVKTSGYSKN